MSRSTRVEFPGALYHVMARGIAKRTVFHEDDDRNNFLFRIGKSVESGDLEVLAFCLMPNHFHLLTRTPRGDLSRWMRAIMGEYGQWANRKYGQAGHFWQGRYKAILVEQGGYLLECSRYIHLNPNRALLTRPAERWKWSSYRNYVRSLGRPAVPWVETATVLRAFHEGGQTRFYRQYVESGKGETPISPFERATAGLVLGSESFVEWVREQVKSRDVSAEEPSLRRLKAVGLASPEQIEKQVDRVFQNMPEHRRRRIKLYCLWRWTSLKGTEAAARFGLGRSATGEAVKSIERQIISKTSLGARLRRVGKDALFPSLAKQSLIVDNGDTAPTP